MTSFPIPRGIPGRASSAPRDPGNAAGDLNPVDPLTETRGAGALLPAAAARCCSLLPSESTGECPVLSGEPVSWLADARSRARAVTVAREPLSLRGA